MLRAFYLEAGQGKCRGFTNIIVPCEEGCATMIVTVTLNPMLERNYQIERFSLTGVHEVSHCVTGPAGGGISVSRILRRLEVPTQATGILGGHLGRLIEAGLHKEEIPSDFVWIRAESRLGTLVVGDGGKIHTRIIEQGPRTPRGAFDRLSSKIEALAVKNHWVVLAGTPPPGAPAAIYARLIRSAQEAGAKVLLDTHGTWLREGIKAQPDLITPNWQEFLQLVGPCYSTVQAIKAARALVADGLGGIVVSMGARGALAVQAESAYFSRPLPTVDVISPVGGGSALAAGLTAKLQAGWDFAASLRFALAVAIAGTAHLGTGIFDPQLAAQLAKQIAVDKTPY